jgi:hypothetical protein
VGNPFVDWDSLEDEKLYVAWGWVVALAFVAGVTLGLPATVLRFPYRWR